MSTRIGILGSGFGLYGYAVAADQLGFNLIAPHSYGKVILSRSDLSCLWERVEFVPTVEDLLAANLDGLVLARRPKDQYEFLTDPNHEIGAHMFLEKPPAPSIEECRSLSAHLQSRNVSFSIGYLFSYTRWHERVTELVATAQSPVCLDIEWCVPQIEQHLKKGSWKLTDHLGGGIANYYGIHFVPLLSSGNQEVVWAKSTANEFRMRTNTRWSYMSGSRSRLDVSVTIKAGPPAFRIAANEGDYSFEIAIRSPFDDLVEGDAPATRDNRIPHLMRYMKEALVRRHANAQDLEELGATIQFMEECRRVLVSN